MSEASPCQNASETGSRGFETRPAGRGLKRKDVVAGEWDRIGIKEKNNGDWTKAGKGRKPEWEQDEKGGHRVGGGGTTLGGAGNAKYEGVTCGPGISCESTV